MVSGRFLSPADDLSQCYAIRRKVFIEEQGVPEELEFDGSDAYAMHLLVFDGEKNVATGRISLIDGIYKIGRVAVLKDERGKNYGDLTVRMLCDRAFRNGAKEVWLDAQLHAVGFYESIGFKTVGTEFLDAGIPHIKMVLKCGNFTTKCGKCVNCD